MTITLQPLIAEMQTQLHHDRVDATVLKQLVELLRPQDVNHLIEIQSKIHAFTHAILLIPAAGEVLQQYLLRLLTQYQQMQVYAVSGILSSAGFNTQLSQRIGEHFLPLLKNPDDLNELVGEIFYKKSDKHWLDQITTEQWQALFGAFSSANANQQQKHVIQMEMINAVMVLSYRISSIGLHPELMHAYPEIDEYESPFLIQNREIIEFIECYKKFFAHDQGISVLPLPDPSQALVMLDQCRNIMRRIKRGTKRSGVSMSLTYLLVLLEQCLHRIEVLLHILTREGAQQYCEMGYLLHSLVRGYYSDKSVRSLLSTNTELVALQITENASRTGEHYVSVDKKGYFAMYRRAAGAGAIIAVMATIKILLSKLTLAPLMQALSYSLNYGLGFVLIHVLRFTVATKQPAMTAAALAATIQQRKGSRSAQLAELAALIINIIRTQTIAILGNITIAMPMAALIVLTWQWMFDQPLIGYAKAAHLLHDINPFESLAIPHAAIAGVCLFLSGLIAGYYDNLAVYRNIGARIKAHPRLQRWFSQARLERIAVYIENNLGAIMGNFLFGCMLGSMGTIGFMLGLPLDIRHIAFASANYIQGLLCMSGDADLANIVLGFIGVLMIGLTNLFVSFSLTIVVALRARRVKVEDWQPLIKLITTHFVTRPSDFFWPPKQPLQVLDKSGKPIEQG